MLVLRTASEVLDEIRRIKNLGSDTALGEIFGVKQTTVASWRSRNSLPYEDVLAFCASEGISTDNLFFKHMVTKVISKNKIDSEHEPTYWYEVDDLFSTRLSRELIGKSVDWIATECNISLQRIENFLSNKAIPTVEEIESLATALNVTPVWLAQRSPSWSENWMYEFYKKDNNGCFPSEIFRMYLVAAEKFIDKMGGLISLSSELKAEVVNTACRVHMKESSDKKEVNQELVRFLLTLAR